MTGERWKNKPPSRLALIRAASDEIAWRCERNTGRTAGTHDGSPLSSSFNGKPSHDEDMKEYSQGADGPKAQVSTSVVQRLKSKFEAKQKGPQYLRAPERAQVPTVQSAQKTVEVPRVQYITIPPEINSSDFGGFWI